MLFLMLFRHLTSGEVPETKEHSTGSSEIAVTTARLRMQELRVMSTLQDGQLWPGANMSQVKRRSGSTKALSVSNELQKASCANTAT